ncbi:hypothetical protein WH47_06318 [Habropoda laboriosa]|uniref:Uncharacterized protein n=1 Tax=Habropoda laboriosa TaxID=597456 RepID=A0A0L7RC15_9HYME|nr:hypothetical protein WH47_06318 [Habropoda laboriosa]
MKLRILKFLNEEYFEVSSSRTRTKWTVRVSGRGVVPSYVLKPRFRVARFDVTDEKQVEMRISIQNTGVCPLIFRLFLIDVFEGEIPQESEELREEIVKKKKERSEGESGGKSGRKVEYSDTLRPNEELAIFGGVLRRSMDRSRFSFSNLDENMQLLVPERKKVFFVGRSVLSTVKMKYLHAEA